MTLIETHITTGHESAAWHEVDEGFWVGSADGRFLGTVECEGSERFFARNNVRAYVGEYPTLAAARRAVVEHPHVQHAQ